MAVDVAPTGRGAGGETGALELDRPGGLLMTLNTYAFPSWLSSP